ncbi:MAG: MAPEG family protein [Paracoccaceae bacterium]|nr:MAPEG family protein [Paracoccaceae bacterium]MDG1737096.1 MAPEG family protein [Paracoccaceae bacterium]MDG2258450.1 MAPEG family protein [Paracoccaceae bacterium]
MSPSLTIEAWGLIALSIQALIHVSVQGLVLKASVGNTWTVGSRDIPMEPGNLAARAKRAAENFQETAIAFLAIALVIILADLSNKVTSVGCIIYIVGRIIYLPAYLAGLPWVRSLIWNASTAGLVAMIVGVFF